MIEVVVNAETTANIHKDKGGATGAFKDDTLLKYINDKNKTEDQLSTAKDNFMRSCAGYCVATYVLGNHSIPFHFLICSLLSRYRR